MGYWYKIRASENEYNFLQKNSKKLVFIFVKYGSNDFV